MDEEACFFEWAGLASIATAVPPIHEQAPPSGNTPVSYGDAFGQAFGLAAPSGEAAIMKLLWMNEGAAWRITAYDIEVP